MSNEVDTRLKMLNTLLTTPHRDMAKIYPVHQEMIKSDPLFYVRLAAWYNDTGDVRDHKEMFIVNLCMSDFEGHRDVGLAMLRELPPYQLARVVDFIHPRKGKKTITRKSTVKGAKPVKTVVENFGLNRSVPGSVKTEVARYLCEREADNDWFDSTVVVARKSLKRLYSLLHIKPSEVAQKALFDKEPVEGSKLAAIKALRQAADATEQAKIIIENKIPYRIASTVVSAMTPTVLLALIEVMSDQELISNIGSLRKRGAFDNADIKAVIEKKLEKAKSGKRVSGLKAMEAAKAAGVSDDVQEGLKAVADTQIKAKGRIIRPTAILVDSSGSMAEAIALGKQMAAMVSAVMDADLYVYAFNSMPYEIKCDGKDLSSWEKAFRGIQAQGNTCCGAPLVQMRKLKQRVEQIVLISDEGENSSPAFLKSYLEYSEDLGVSPSVFVLRCGRFSSIISDKLKRADIDVDVYDFTGTDYYSLPNLIKYLTKTSKLDLLMEIMGYELPKRKVA